jgi:hypothetical protein
MIYERDFAYGPQDISRNYLVRGYSMVILFWILYINNKWLKDEVSRFSDKWIKGGKGYDFFFSSLVFDRLDCLIWFGGQLWYQVVLAPSDHSCERSNRGPSHQIQR